MATSAPPHSVPNLRNMRDTYVNLLLSNGQQPIDTAPPQTPRAAWTPGQGLGAPYKEHAVHWASPVTPGLTENEMRVAEVAANLVAAGDAEKRNKDAIRALTDKLEETERRNRQLEAAARTEENKKKDNRRISYGDARRNIHFTPRTPRRSGGLDPGTERRRSRKLESEWLQESPFHLELESLRMERVQWHQEREKFRSMMSDIKRNTSRLLEEREKLRRHRNTSAEERNAHLQVIAHLQNQLLEKKQKEELEDRHALDSATRRCGDDVHSPHPKTTYHRGLSRAPNVRHREVLNEERNACPNQDQNPNSTSAREIIPTPSEQEMSGVQDDFGREEELQTELHLVNQENIRVSDRNAALGAENTHLQERIRLLEAEHASLHAKLHHLEHRAIVESGTGNSSVPISNTQLAKLLEEINILESVSVAIHFEISPSEADRAQETLTDVGSFTSDRDSKVNASRKKHVKEQGFSIGECEQQKDVISKSPVDTIKHATHRIAAIRTDLCSKYGRWLEAVANDVSCASADAGLGSMDDEKVALFQVAPECMNTKVINELVES